MGRKLKEMSLYSLDSKIDEYETLLEETNNVADRIYYLTQLDCSRCYLVC